MASTQVCGCQGPRALGRGLGGVRACARRPRGQTLPATVYEGPPCPPLLTAGVPRGFGGRLPSAPAPAGHPQAHLCLSGSVGLMARPALPSTPLPHPSSSSTSHVPAHPGPPLGNGFGDDAKQHLGDKCTQAGPGLPWPRPTPPRPQFPHLLPGTAGPPGPAGTPSRRGHKLGTRNDGDSSQLSGSPPRDTPEGDWHQGAQQSQQWAGVKPGQDPRGSACSADKVGPRKHSAWARPWPGGTGRAPLTVSAETP